MAVFSRESWDWYISSASPAAPARVSPTRDVFLARLDGMYRECARAGWEGNECALVTAIVGEVGNNSFDHNIGLWRDVPGCWFECSVGADRADIAVADRGQGILSSLRVADPALSDDQGAVEAAFHRIITGRSPERRGNGLKFVRSVVNGHDGRGLCCLSGKGVFSCGGSGSDLKNEFASLSGNFSRHGRGTIVLFRWVTA